MDNNTINWGFIDDLIQSSEPSRETEVIMLREEVRKRNQLLQSMQTLMQDISFLNYWLAASQSATQPELLYMVRNMHMRITDMALTVQTYSNIDFQALGSSENRPA